MRPATTWMWRELAREFGRTMIDVSGYVSLFVVAYSVIEWVSGDFHPPTAAGAVVATIGTRLWQDIRDTQRRSPSEDLTTYVHRTGRCSLPDGHDGGCLDHR